MQLTKKKKRSKLEFTAEENITLGELGKKCNMLYILHSRYTLGQMWQNSWIYRDAATYGR